MSTNDPKADFRSDASTMPGPSWETMTWPCGHVTSKGYQHWPRCPVCALEDGEFMKTREAIGEASNA